MLRKTFSFSLLLSSIAWCAGPLEVRIHADRVIANVSPALYGLMTEEINYSYDGGLYAELVRNRSFKEDANEPVYWSTAGEIILKVVNRGSAAQAVHIQVSEVAAVQAKGEAIVMSASSPDDTNSITEPKRIVPVVAAAEGLGKDLTREFPAYSITVLRLKAH
jgi:hypothetical protein